MESALRIIRTYVIEPARKSRLKEEDEKRKIPPAVRSIVRRLEKLHRYEKLARTHGARTRYVNLHTRSGKSLSSPLPTEEALNWPSRHAKRGKCTGSGDVSWRRACIPCASAESGNSGTHPRVGAQAHHRRNTEEHKEPLACSERRSVRRTAKSYDIT